MSKKETRRAAREAFPKAKTPPSARGKPGSRPRSAAASRNRGSTARRPGQRPPSIKRAVIWGLVMAVIYFVLIQYLWKSSGTPTATNAIVAVIGFVLFAAIVYGVDHFKYQRYLRKQKSSNK